MLNLLNSIGKNISLPTENAASAPAFPNSPNVLSRIEADNPANIDATVSEAFLPSDVDTINNKINLTSTGFAKYSDYTITPVYFSSTGTLPAPLQVNTPYICIDTTGGIEFYPWANDADYASLPYFREGETILPAMHMAFGMNKIQFTDQGTGTHTLYTRELVSRMQDMTTNDFSAVALDNTNPNACLEKDSDTHGDYFIPRGGAGTKRTLTVSPTYGQLMANAGSKANWGAALSGKRYLYTVFTARMKPWYWNNAVTNIIEPANVTIATGRLYQINHSFKTGDTIESGVIANGVLPAGMPAGDTYAKKVDNNRFTLHPTEADAVANTNPITFTDQGSGEFYFKAVQRAQTAGDAQYVFDMNWPSGSQHMIAPSFQGLTDYTDMGSSSYIFATSGGNMGYIWNSITTAHIPDGTYRKVKWWHPTRAVAPTCQDTGLPLENGEYWVTSNGTFIKLHRTKAGAIAGKDLSAAASDCIKFTARGKGVAYITIIDELQMTNFGMRSDTHQKTYFPDDDSVNTFAMMIDWNPSDATKPKLYVGRNGLWNLIDGEESNYYTKQLIASGSLAELKFFNAAEPHVSGRHELYSNVVCASDTDPTPHIQALMDYYKEKHKI